MSNLEKVKPRYTPEEVRRYQTNIPNYLKNFYHFKCTMSEPLVEFFTTDVKTAFKPLDKVSREVVELRFGMRDGKMHTYLEIESETGLKRCEIKNIIQQSVDTVQEHFQLHKDYEL